MVKLSYNLDEIKDFGYEPGRCRAKLKSVKKKDSRAGKPMLVFEWAILTGDNKGNKISSYPSLQPNALSSLKEHLQALGLDGKVSISSDKLLGKNAVLVLAEVKATDGSGRTFVSVARVLPKDASLSDDDDYDDEDEEEDDEDYDEEDDEDEDDEEWDDEDEEEDEEPAPRKKSRSKR